MAGTRNEREPTGQTMWAAFSWISRNGATRDHVMQIAGAVAAAGAGAALPAVVLLWGDLTNSFMEFAQHNSSFDGRKLLRDVNQRVLWMVALFIGKLCLCYAYMVLFSLSAARLGRNIRLRQVGTLLHQDVSFFDETTSQESSPQHRNPVSAAATMDQVLAIENGFGEKLGLAIQMMSSIGAAFIVAFTRSWRLTLVTGTIIPITVAVVAVTVVFDSAFDSKILQIYGAANSMAELAFVSIREIVAYTAHAKFTKLYDSYMERARKCGLKKAIPLGVQYSFEYFFMFCGYSLSFWYGFQLYKKQEIAGPGEIITVFFCVIIASSSMTAFSIQVPHFTNAASAASSLMQLSVRNCNSNPSLEGIIALDHVEGILEFKKVIFRYPSRPSITVLDIPALNISAGKTVAVLGPSGSGKSTIVALLERWYELTEGEILLDGHDIRLMNRQRLRSYFGLVQQEPVLFNCTIYENVAYGLLGTLFESESKQKKRELVEDACRLANAHEFVTGLPQGYDTHVGERGSLLSGGQKQRIAIARAIVGDPRILLLDEATSALDLSSEALVQSALDNASKHRTTISITHKASTTRTADTVLVFKDGVITEQGSPAELIQAGGWYADLIKNDRVEQHEKSNSLGFKEPCGGPDRDIDGAIPLASSKVSPHPAKASFSSACDRPMSLPRCLLIIFRDQKELWPWMCATFAPCVLGGLIHVVEAILFGHLIAVFTASAEQMQKKANFWALWFFVLALGTLVTYGLAGFNGTILSQSLSKAYRSRYFYDILRQDVPFFDKPDNGPHSLASKLSGHASQVQSLVSMNLAMVLIVIVNVISCSVLSIAVGWKLGLVGVFGALPPICLAGGVRMRLESRFQHKMSQYYSESARFSNEAIGAIRTVASLTLEQTIYEAYSTRLRDALLQVRRHTIGAMILFAFTESVEICGMALTFWYGAQLLVEGGYSLRQFFTIFAAVVFGGQATSVLFGFTSSFTKARAAATETIKLRRSHTTFDDIGGIVLPDGGADVFIHFKDVSFSYPSRLDITVLQGLSFKVMRGQTVGFVGLSGSGKSTVLSLIERFYNADSGEILIGGIEIGALDIRAYRESISLVAQEPILYDGSIRDNILLGLASEVPEEALIKACKAACIYDFIISLPQGFETNCGRRGVVFSGGQKQRIAIARALLRNPRLLLLDESTSALDFKAERDVQEALMNASVGRTTIVVAHRLSTVEKCDKIFLFENGRVIESGNHEELVAQGGKYCAMLKMSEEALL